MSTNDKLHGIALSCDENGVIDTIIRDDFGIIARNTKPKLVATLFEKTDIAKILDFILQIKVNGVVFDFPLSIQQGNQYKNLSFTGFYIDDRVFIIGVDTPSDSLMFINQLQHINNDQANQLRSLLKKKISTSKQSTNESVNFVDELSSLNNELVNLQRELAKKNAELARLNNLKNEFLGMAAHDVRNPLGIILSYSEFLLEQTKNQISEKHKSFLEIIYSSAEFLLDLIEDLLDITQIESGKITINPVKSNLIELAQKNITLNNTLASTKNIQIHLSTKESVLELNCDTRKIEQVFNNLITNAVKFSHPNSEVTVTIAKKKNNVLIEVIDQGIGIDSDSLHKIFIPFGRILSEGTNGEKCTGLGLSIVKKIIEGHNGSINVESIPGKGSRFYFEIPIV